MSSNGEEDEVASQCIAVHNPLPTGEDYELADQMLDSYLAYIKQIKNNANKAVVHGHSLRVASDTLRNSRCDSETGKRAANIFSGLAAPFFWKDDLPCEADGLASVVLSLSARERNTSLAPTVPATVYRSRTRILEDFDENSEETREDQDDRLITEYVASMIPLRQQNDEWLTEQDKKDTSAPDTATQAARDPDLPEGHEWLAGYDKSQGTTTQEERQKRVAPHAASKRWSGSSRAMFSRKSQS